jgi:hypothetical protein
MFCPLASESVVTKHLNLRSAIKALEIISLSVLERLAKFRQRSYSPSILIQLVNPKSEERSPKRIKNINNLLKKHIERLKKKWSTRHNFWNQEPTNIVESICQCYCCKIFLITFRKYENMGTIERKTYYILSNSNRSMGVRTIFCEHF